MSISTQTSGVAGIVETLSSNSHTPLPSGWRWARLGDVCVENTGTRDPGLQPDSHFLYVDISSVDNEAKCILEPKSLLGAEAPSRARQVIRTGDVIVSTTRPNLNAVALVPPSLDNQICSTGFCVLRPTDKIDGHYLFAFVQSQEFVQSLTELVKGALYPAVTDKQVRSQFIPLAPLPEQQRIAAILTAQMAAVARARAAAEAQVAAAQALPAAYLRAVFDSAEAEGWPIRQWGEICDFQGGTQPPKSTFNNVPQPGYVRLLQIQDFKSDDYAVYIQDSPQLNKCDESDVLIGRYGASVGRILRGKAGAYNVALVKTLPDLAVISKDFLYYLLQGEKFQSLLRTVSARAAQAGFNKADVNTLRIPLPSLLEQRRIVATLTEQMAGAEQVRQALEAQLTAINQLPAALLRQAFRGEV